MYFIISHPPLLRQSKKKKKILELNAPPPPWSVLITPFPIVFSKAQFEVQPARFVALAFQCNTV